MGPAKPLAPLPIPAPAESQKLVKTRVSTQMAEAPPPETATTVQLTSCPTSWFRDPLDAAIKKLIRPSTALTRRKELEIKLQIPRDVFEDWISPLAELDAWSLIGV